MRSKGVDYDGFPIDTGTIVATGFLDPAGSCPLVLAANNVYHDWSRTAELGALVAAQAEACRRELGIAPERLNVDGGAIALGHPLGATGGRLIGTAVRVMNRVGGKHALATQCIGGGMGIAMLLAAV